MSELTYEEELASDPADLDLCSGEPVEDAEMPEFDASQFEYLEEYDEGDDDDD